MNTQAAWARALLDPDLPCPDGLRSWNGSDPTRRFAVYRNNIVVSLVDALAEQFPVTAELVGTEFFRAMARVFLQHHAPRSRLVAFAGVPLADFIAAFAPAAPVPYLADVARLEMARIRACHAADTSALTATEIASAVRTPDRLAQLRLQLHPSVQLLSSRFAFFSLWAAHQGAGDIAGLDPDLAQQVLVFREGLDVQTMALDSGPWCFLTRLAAGDVLAQAAGAASLAQPNFDLAGAIALLLRHPLVTPRVEVLA